MKYPNAALFLTNIAIGMALLGAAKLWELR